MADFERAFARTVDIEKGYQHSKIDKGNTKERGTVFGIAGKYHPKEYDAIMAYLKLGDMKGAISVVKMVYRKEYWNPIQADRICSQIISDHLFDISINSYCDTAIELVQKALNHLGLKVAVDKKMGDKTLTAINLAPIKELNNVLVEMRKAYTKELCEQDPSQQGNKKGWDIRAESFRLA